MRKTFSAVATVFLLVAAPLRCRSGESTIDYAVQVSAAVEKSPTRITLSWPEDTARPAATFVVYRKSLEEMGWNRLRILPAGSTSFIDTNVCAGVGYEYQVQKIMPHYNAYGYIYAGIELPLVENRGRVLLVMESTCGAEVAEELRQLEQDMVGDGWRVTCLTVARTDSVIKVKKLIKTQYKADPENLKCVFLFGHVPVPYSGNIVPDGHAPDHQGAWPCDGYYGDMDGNWTDHSVRVTCANDARNRNVPGDGKFDQSSFPAPIKLMVGRVDLANMPGRLTPGGPATFPSEVELLRNYLRKDHQFRTKAFDVPRRAYIGDYFGCRNGEAFAASGWRNFAPFFGPGQVIAVPHERCWIPMLSTNACLWAYGCGPGTFTSIGGLGNSNEFHDGVTPELVGNDVKAVFTILFGSWFGDWDAEDDMLRAVLATPSYGLACGWSGRPHWFLHHMALGEPIGFSARLTQNNGPDGLYQNQVNNGAGDIQIALMGDPTLRMHVVAPPEEATVSTNGDAVTIDWSASPDDVLGYNVYEAPAPEGPFSRVNAEMIRSESFTARGPLAGAYMVRAVKLERSASGTYFNASQGAFVVPGEYGNRAVIAEKAKAKRRETGG